MTTDATWQHAARHSPLLRSLDDSARNALLTSARIRTLADGQALYRAGEPGDSLYVVVEGRLSVRAIRRGDDVESQLRTVSRGDSVGEEALLPGLSRRATATAQGPVQVAELPISVFRRLVAKAGDDAGERAGRERRILERTAARDLIATHALTRDLDDTERDTVLDAAHFQHLERGQRLFSVGEPVADCFLIVDGLVQLQSSDGELGDESPDSPPRALAYLVGGDILGHDQLRSDERRALTAVAMGPTHVLRVPVAIIRELGDRNPGLLRQVSRIAGNQERAQVRLLERAEQQTTRHVFRDLYRMQMARSLLVIDQDQCVRCGHCAWSCASVHGESRLIRRGDKLVARVVEDASRSHADAPRSLLVPNSCQHCHHAACMIDCPTGAIGRDPQGEVFIRPSLCTGCGHCAKACPWENIRMAPRAEQPATPELSAEVAVKCDLCRAYQAPACVLSCPTGALVRLDPSRDIAELGRFLGHPSAPAASAHPADASPVPAFRWTAIVSALQLWFLAVAVAGVPWALFAHADGAIRPGAGFGLLAGWLSGLVIAALASYALVKRAPRRLMKVRERESAARQLARADEGSAPSASSDRPRAANAARSRLRRHYLAHVALGLVSIAVVCAHAGARMPASPAGAAMAGFWLVALLGVLGELGYRLLPTRLSRLERRGALPEDLAGERVALLARLHRQTSGADSRIKALLAEVVIPYARSLTGALALFFSGRSLSAEEARLRAALAAEHKARWPGARVPDMSEFIRIAVEIRALPSRRACTFVLRAWLPAHLLASAVFLASVLVHIATASLAS